jgi:hypothetical protein
MDDLTKRALAAYRRAAGPTADDGIIIINSRPQPRAAAKPAGPTADIPAGAESGPEKVDGKEYVVLRNAHGVVAVYRVGTSGALRRLRRWPRDLEA